MTGRYASHTGIGPDVLVENVPFGVPGREVFMPAYLKKAGYKTHAVRIAKHAAA
jgi:arylsulfatase A-like enzyme